MADFAHLQQTMPGADETLEGFFETIKELSAADKCFLDQCSVLLECKNCRNMFRSVHNLILHKTKYCVQSRNAVVHANGGEVEKTGEEEEVLERPKLTTQQKKFKAKEEAREKENVKEKSNEKESPEAVEKEERKAPATLDLFSQSRAQREAPLMKFPDGQKKVVGTLPCHLARLDMLPPNRTPLSLPQDNLSRHQTMERLTAQESPEARKCTPGELKIMEYMEEKDIRCANIDTNQCEHPSCEETLKFHSLEALAYHCTVYHSESTKNEDGEEKWTCLLCNREVTSLEVHLKKSHSKVKDEHIRKRKDELKKAGKDREEVASFRSRSLSPSAKTAMEEEKEKTDGEEEEAEKYKDDLRIAREVVEDIEDDEVTITSVVVKSLVEKKEKVDANKANAADKKEGDGGNNKAETSTSKTSDRLEKKDESKVEEEKEVKKETVAQTPQTTSSVQVKKQAQLSNVIDRITAKVSPPRSISPTGDTVAVDGKADESNDAKKKEEDGENSNKKKAEEVQSPKKDEVDPAESVSKSQVIVKSQPREEIRDKGKKNDEGSHKKVSSGEKDGQEKVLIADPAQTEKTIIDAKAKTSEKKEDKPSDKKEEKEVIVQMTRLSRMPSKSEEGSSSEIDKKDGGREKEGEDKVSIHDPATIDAKSQPTEKKDDQSNKKKEEKEEAEQLTRRSRILSTGVGLSAKTDEMDDGKEKESAKSEMVNITDPAQINGIVSKETEKTATDKVENPIEKKEEKSIDNKEETEVVGKMTRRSRNPSKSGEGFGDFEKKKKEGNDKVSIADPAQIDGIDSKEIEKTNADAKEKTADKTEMPIEKKEANIIEPKEENSVEKKDEKEVIGTMTRRSRTVSKSGEGSSAGIDMKDKKKEEKGGKEKVTISDPAQANCLVPKETDKTPTDANIEKSEENPTEKKEEKSCGKKDEKEIVGQMNRRSRVPSKSDEGSSAQTGKKEDEKEKTEIKEKVIITDPAQVNTIASNETETVIFQAEAKNSEKQEDKGVVGTMTRRSRNPSKSGEGSSAQTEKKDDGNEKNESKEKAIILDPVQVNGLVSKETEKTNADAKNTTADKKSEKPIDNKEEKKVVGSATPRGSRQPSIRRMPSMRGQPPSALTVKDEAESSKTKEEKNEKSEVKRAPSNRMETPARPRKSIENTETDKNNKAEVGDAVTGGGSNEKKDGEDQEKKETPKRGRPPKQVDSPKEEGKESVKTPKGGRAPSRPSIGKAKDVAGSSKQEGEKKEGVPAKKKETRAPSKRLSSIGKAEDVAGSSKQEGERKEGVPATKYTTRAPSKRLSMKVAEDVAESSKQEGEKKDEPPVKKTIRATSRRLKRKAEDEEGASKEGEEEKKKVGDDQAEEEPKTPKIGRPRKSTDEVGSSKTKKTVEKSDDGAKEDADEKEKTTPKVARSRKSLKEGESSKKKKKAGGEKEETGAVKRKRGRPSKDKKSDETETKKDEDGKEEEEKNDDTEDERQSSSGRVRKRPHWMTNGDYDESTKKKETNDPVTANGVDGPSTSKQDTEEQPAEKKEKKEKDVNDQAGTSKDGMPSTSQVTRQAPVRRESIRAKPPI